MIVWKCIHRIDTRSNFVTASLPILILFLSLSLSLSLFRICYNLITVFRRNRTAWLIWHDWNPNGWTYDYLMAINHVSWSDVRGKRMDRIDWKCWYLLNFMVSYRLLLFISLRWEPRTASTQQLDWDNQHVGISMTVNEHVLVSEMRWLNEQRIGSLIHF